MWGELIFIAVWSFLTYIIAYASGYKDGSECICRHPLAIHANDNQSVCLHARCGCSGFKLKDTYDRTNGASEGCN